jgi:hypothetical protein
MALLDDPAGSDRTCRSDMIRIAGGTGRLDKALDEAKAKGWIVVDMKQDWRTVFPMETGR